MLIDKRTTTPRLILIGGFLGAGKTTLISGLGKLLHQRKLQYGVITNDQGVGLVDTTTAREQKAVAVEEITGGCFCCQLDDLVATLKRISRKSKPDVILAEPVGSCTDLAATVLLPLERVYHLPLETSPYAVVLDPRRVTDSLGIQKTQRRSFSKNVGYIYRKQIEEAEWLIINKSDLLDNQDLQTLLEGMAEKYPNKRLFTVSARSGEGLGELLEALLSETSHPNEVMEVDYERYGEGEALMGWYNATLEVKMAEGIQDWLKDLGGKISAQLKGYEVGHFKMSLETTDGRVRMHQVISTDVPEMAGDLPESANEGTLLINLRAEAAPAILEKAVETVMADSAEGVSVKWVEKAAFRPGQPVPTHRVSSIR